MNSKLTEDLRGLLKGVRTLAVVCNQWGDGGKGKIVDLFSDWADIIVRGTGGANAGHTIKLGGKTYVFHLVPSGILYDGKGKLNIIGTGTVVDPQTLCSELEVLQRERIGFEGLRISLNAKLILPQHYVMEQVREMEESGKIGTTGRAIGLCYVDHYDRIGLRVNDLLNKDCFVEKLRRNLREKVRLLKSLDPEAIRNIVLHHKRLGVQFWNPEFIFDLDAIVTVYERCAQTLGPMIIDTDELVRHAVGTSNLLLEGAQGNLLSVDHGSYPYVTSSDASVQGLAKGAGLSENDVDLALGIIKGFYMTRVGEGPFPTELGGIHSAEWCANKEANREWEREHTVNASVNDPDPFLQGVGIRIAGDEYGATTGRPRRIGWLDLPLLRHSMKYNGHVLVLTKLDVLDECEEIRICTEHKYWGDSGYRFGATKLWKHGTALNTALMDHYVLSHCEPVYERFRGWKTPTSGIRSLAELPYELKVILDFVRKQTNGILRILSVGAEREQTIVVT